jgi:hypothetical protein
VSELHRVGDLEIEQDMAFQQKEWVLERWGWMFIFIIVLAAFGGLFGTGPLSNTRAGGESLFVEYQRFARVERTTDLSFHLQTAQSGADKVNLWIDREYLDHFRIVEVTPPHESTSLAPDRMIYTFQVEATDQPLRITLRLEPQDYGIVPGSAGIAETDQAVNFRQFIYP